MVSHTAIKDAFKKVRSDMVKLSHEISNLRAADLQLTEQLIVLSREMQELMHNSSKKKSKK